MMNTTSYVFFMGVALGLRTSYPGVKGTTFTGYLKDSYLEGFKAGRYLRELCFEYDLPQLQEIKSLFKKKGV